jgi:hypothetical protein
VVACLVLRVQVAVIAKAGVRVIVSSLGGQYVAGQAPWGQIFQEELMPSGLTDKEQKNVVRKKETFLISIVCTLNLVEFKSFTENTSSHHLI